MFSDYTVMAAVDGCRNTKKTYGTDMRSVICRNVFHYYQTAATGSADLHRFATRLMFLPLVSKINQHLGLLLMVLSSWGEETGSARTFGWLVDFSHNVEVQDKVTRPAASLY